jgi:putative tryptophan/tyrosine transport system substrate-binding protein
MDALRTLSVTQAWAGPVANGLAQSLSPPGGTVTGIVLHTDELNAKRLELVHELLPGARRISYLAGPTLAGAQTAGLQTVAGDLGLELLIVPTSGAESFAAAFMALQERRAEAVVVEAWAAFLDYNAGLAGRARAADPLPRPEHGGGGLPGSPRP